jgi:hypothetical protein
LLRHKRKKEGKKEEKIPAREQILERKEKVRSITNKERNILHARER